MIQEPTRSSEGNAVRISNCQEAKPSWLSFGPFSLSIYNSSTPSSFSSPFLVFYLYINRERERERESVDMAGEKEMAGVDFSTLPEGCISHVLSLTSPLDACRAAMVSPVFRSAEASDTVWERFLPSDIAGILARAVDRVQYSSKRDLFFRLCGDPILIDDRKMVKIIFLPL